MSETRPAVSITDGAKIRDLRKTKLGISGVKFAERLGIRSQSLVNIEQNRRTPALKLLIQIARQLDESIDSLIREDAAA